MTAASLRLRPAVPGDAAFMAALERQPSSGGFVTRWSEARHRAVLDDPAFATLIGHDGDETARGFVLFGGRDDPHGNLCMLRIVVDRPGEGLGGRLLDAAVDWAFRETGTHRLWLDVLVENQRARQVYARHGFREEGVFRQSFVRPDGSRTDCAVLSLLRPEWRALRGL